MLTLSCRWERCLTDADVFLHTAFQTLYAAAVNPLASGDGVGQINSHYADARPSQY